MSSRTPLPVSDAPKTAKSPAPKSAADPKSLVFPLCAIAIFAGVVLLLAGRMWPEVAYRLLVEGSFAAIWLASAGGIGKSILDLARIRSDSKALIFSTSSAVGLGVMSLLLLGLGLMGWLNRGSAIGLVVLGLLAGAKQVSKLKSQISNRQSSIGNFRWLWLLVVPTIAITIVGAFILPGVLWGDEPNGYDVLEYHLQVPREWYELGKIVPLHHNVFSFFPFNVEMHYLLAMYLRGGPWAGMYLAQLMHAIFVGLTVVAVYGAVESLATKPRAAMLSAIAAASVPWMSMLGAVAYNEGGLLLFGTLAVAWAMQKDRSLKTMALAGALAGFACGTKLTAVPMVLLSIPVAWFLCRVRFSGPVTSDPDEITGPLKRSVQGAAAFFFAGIITFSPWLIRNAIWTGGNPVFPEAMNLLGKGHFTDIQVERWNRAHSPREDQRVIVHRLAAFNQQILSDWRYGFVGLPIELAAIILARKQRAARFLAIVLLVQLIVWIGFTHLQGRFFVLAVPIASILMGIVEWPGWRTLIGLVTAGSVTVGIAVLGPRTSKVAVSIGMEDYEQLFRQTWSAYSTVTHQDDAARVLSDSSQVYLIGDARAFQYPIPMSRLNYRTVFDVGVVQTPGEDENQFIIRAWSGGALPSDALIMRDSLEVRRLSLTYWGLPEFRKEIELIARVVIDSNAFRLRSTAPPTPASKPSP